MAILVKNMKMPTRCWDCYFYKTGHEESYCGLTGKDVPRWTPTPRPDDCPLVEVEPEKHGYWIWTGSCQVCSICDEEQYGVDTGRYYCPNCGARMDGTENE